jgi:ABC-2 type transport system ATP-binding protein
VEEVERRRRRRLVVRARDSAARVLLHQAGFNAEVGSQGMIEVHDAAAIERPEGIATRLVEAGCPPTELKVEEDLEAYFLRLVGMDGGSPR